MTNQTSIVARELDMHMDILRKINAGSSQYTEFAQADGKSVLDFVYDTSANALQSVNHDNFNSRHRSCGCYFRAGQTHCWT